MKNQVNEHIQARKVRAKRLKELQKENSKLKRLVGKLSLEKQVLKDIT